MEVAEEKPPLQELYDEYNPKLNLAKTYDEFAATMKNESSRKDFFDTFNKDLNLAKDFNEFEGVLGLKKNILPQSEPTPKEPKTPSLGYGSEQEAITGGAQKDFTSPSPLVSNVKSEKTPKITDADPLKILEAAVKTQSDTSPQDFIPPKVAKIPTVSPKMVTEKNYQITVQKYQQADKQAKDLGSQLEQAHPEILKIKSDMDAEFQDASQQTAKSLHDQFQQKVQNKELSIEDANVQLQGEIKKSHDAIAKGIQDKYAPQFAKFNELYNAAIEADSEAKLQYDRATAFEKAQGIIDRNNQAETDSRQNYGNLEGATESGLYLLNKGFYGAVPLVFRAVDAMKYVGEGVDVNRAFDFANIDANASPIMSGLEKLSNQYSELHKEKAAQVERRTGTMDEALAKNDYVKFAELSGLSLVEFAPTMLGQSALALVTGGTSSALNVLANTAVFGAQSYYGDVKDRTDMSEKQKFSNAVTNGAIFTMASETMGRLAIPFKNLITTVGREEAEKTIATTLSGSLKGGLKNLTPFFKASSGAFEVGSLGYVQTWGNALTDPQYKDWTPQQINNEAMKSFVKMAGMGAAGSLLGTGIPEMIKSDIFTGKNKKAATDVSSKIDEIDKTLPTLDETMQQMLAQKKMDLTSSLNDIIIKDAKETEHLSAPQRQKLIELNETGNNITETLENKETPIEGEPKKVLEDNLKDIEKAKDELIKSAQNRLKLSTTPELQLTAEAQDISDNIDKGVTLDTKDISLLSDELYGKLKALNAIKDQPNRKFTIDQINEVKAKLEPQISALEKAKTELTESGKEFIKIDKNEWNNEAKKTEAQPEEVVASEEPKTVVEGTDKQEPQGTGEIIGKAKIDINNNSAITVKGKEINFRVTKKTDSDIEQDFLTITALDKDGKKVGYATFLDDGKNNLEGSEVEIPSKEQKQGIASAIYDYAEARGFKVKESVLQTPEGRALWRSLNRNKETATPQEVKTTENGTEKINKQKVVQSERPSGNESRKATKTGSSNSLQREKTGKEGQVTEEKAGDNKPAISEPDIKNLEKIGKENDLTSHEVRGIYNKYGEGKPLSEVTPADFKKAQEKQKFEKHNKLAYTLNQFNKLSPAKRSSKKETANRNKITKLAEELGYTVKQENDGKLTAIGDTGKSVKTIGLTEELPTPDQSQTNFALRIIDGGFLKTPESGINLDMSWADIRKGQKDLQEGKMTTPAKRLALELDNARKNGGFEYKEGTGADINRREFFVSFDDLKFDVDHIEDVKLTPEQEAQKLEDFANFEKGLSVTQKENLLNLFNDENTNEGTENKSDVGTGKLEEKNPTKSLADKIRAYADSKEIKLLDGNGKEIIITKSGFGQKEILYKIADLVEGGAKIIDAIHEVLKDQKWFIALTDKGKESVVKQFEDSVNEKVPTEPKKGVKDYGDPEMTKMANAFHDTYIEGKLGIKALDDVIAKLQDTTLSEIYDKVKAKLEAGTINVKDVRDRVMTNQYGSEQDQAVLLYDAAQLKGKEAELRKEIIESTDEKEKIKLQKDLLNTLNDLQDNALASRSLGRSASTVFRLRQVMVDKTANLTDMMEQYKASKGVKDLTAKEKAEVTDQYNKLKELEGKITEIKANEKKLQEENEKLKSENETLKKLQEAAKTQKRADRNISTKSAIEKSKQRIESSRAKLRELYKASTPLSIIPINPLVAIEISKIAKEHVYQGVVKFDEVVKNVLDDIKDIFPDFTDKDVREHMAYVKSNKPPGEESKIARVFKRTAQIIGRTESKDFETKKRAVYEKSDALKAAEKEYTIARFNWEKDRRADMMAKRPMIDKIADNILQWQRFAVLSYPTTVIKLAAVVFHGIVLKPVRFATQGLINLMLPKGITEKQSLWGKPEFSAIGKFYSTFVRNFALSNFKEHMTGVDIHEAQYGKPFIYDEWTLGRGIMQMPGRSHGYIKSFIKNSEFEYAHEQITKNYIGKMAAIEKELQNKDLSESDRKKLENDYKQVDVSKEEVDDVISKLSLEHGKWSILMNDNAITDKLRYFMENTGMTGKALHTELPIIKIPLNYIGRVFATKYGLITSLIGKRSISKNGVPLDHPGLVSLMFKGTKNLTPKEADLLGRSLTIGTIGASMFALGYMNRKNIVQEDDGSYTIFGVHINKNLIHEPAFESAFSGAHMGNQIDQNKNADAFSFIESFVESDIDVIKKSPFISMLKYGAIPDLTNVMFDKADDGKKWAKANDAIAKKLADMVEPGFMKQGAEFMDKDAHSNVIKRKPQGENNIDRFWQQFELGIPKLRENVPIKGGIIPNQYEIDHAIETKQHTKEVKKEHKFTPEERAKKPEMIKQNREIINNDPNLTDSQKHAALRLMKSNVKKEILKERK